MPEKPYDRCLNCTNLGVRCDGPNFLAMTIDRWIEWCRKRKDFLGWTNYVVSCESDVPESTVNRILSGASKDIRVTTMQAITKALINGTWGQYPCADPSSKAAEECERLKKQLEQLEKVYEESKEEHSRAIGYFKDLLSESKRALKSHKIAVLILGSILVALACVEFAIPNMGWIRW